MRSRPIFSSSAFSYTTSFPLTENPISESSHWTQGKVVGLDWNNMQSTGGNAVGTAESPIGFDDNIAHLSGFAPDHYVEAVFFRNGADDPSLECELLLRFSITAHVARGYECLANARGGGTIVRWNGAVGDFTELTPTGPGPSALVNGDILRATITGTTITLKVNTVTVLTVTDATWATGNPGMGTFFRGDATFSITSCGWSSLTAANI